jgi:hypothetical protein
MSYAERMAERKAAGRRIDPATALAWMDTVQIADPYGELGIKLGDEDDCVGRVGFAADPVERIAVCRYDLPMETWNAICEREETRRKEETEALAQAAEPWEETR